jgi:hypothetical protein
MFRARRSAKHGGGLRTPTKSRAEQRALKAMSDYIRENENWTCFTCDKKGDKHNMDAGHLFSRRHAAIKFNELNVHCQCVACNKYLSGNMHEYIKRFKEKYGEDRYLYLDDIKGKITKRTVSEYLEIEKEYKEKLKLIRGE